MSLINKNWILVELKAYTPQININTIAYSNPEFMKKFNIKNNSIISIGFMNEPFKNAYLFTLSENNYLLNDEISIPVSYFRKNKIEKNSGLLRTDIFINKLF